ncbi:anti-sigma factor antagonist [Streptomyces sp. SID4948]|nr:anti-sigma factor antagonist [Streptomyces sp. SID4948]
MPYPLDAHRQDTKTRALITLAGEIDMQSAPLIRESLARCLRDGIRTIDIDLTTVTFCDCSGLNAFLAAALLTSAAGGSLRLHYPSSAIARLFALTGSDALFSRLPERPAGLRDELPCAV